MRWFFAGIALLVLLFPGAAPAWAATSASQPTTATSPASDLATRYAATQPALASAHQSEFCRKVESILIGEAREQLRQLRPFPRDHDARVIAQTPPDRQPLASAQTAFALSVLSHCGSETGGAAARAYREQAIGLLHFCVGHSHSVQPFACAFQAGKAAWLSWNDLTSDLKWRAAGMICDAADQALTEPHANDDPFEADILALAYNMFRNHPHHAAWGEAAIRDDVRLRSAPADLQHGEPVDGKPISKWITAAALTDDYLLQIDGRIDPDAMAGICTTAYQKLLYDWGHNPVPKAVSFNLDEIYKNLKFLSLADGGFLQPTGTVHPPDPAADHLDLHVLMADLLQDSQAAALARLALDTASRACGGGQRSLTQSPADLLFRHANAYLLLRQAGPGPAPLAPDQLWQQLAGNHLLSRDLDLLRTEHSVAAFSWGKRITGIATGLRKDRLLISRDGALIGNVWTKSPVGPVRDVPQVKTFRRISPIDPASAAPGVPPLPKEVFAIAGVLARAGGLIEQPFAFVALPDGRVVYLDAAHLTSEKRPLRCDFGTLFALNDDRLPWQNGLRQLYFDQGEITFSAREAQRNSVAHFSSRWFCLDHLGIVVLSSSGSQRYDPHPLELSGPIEQRLDLSDVTRMPDDLLPTALVFYPDSDWSRTRAAAGQCAFQQSDPEHFSITLEDGKAIAVDFTRNVITMTP